VSAFETYKDTKNTKDTKRKSGPARTRSWCPLWFLVSLVIPVLFAAGCAGES